MKEIMASRPPFDQFDAGSENIESYPKDFKSISLPMTVRKTTLLNNEEFIDINKKQLF